MRLINVPMSIGPDLHRHLLRYANTHAKDTLRKRRLTG